MKKKIRVGMIRCDLHAIYYATLIQKHDPAILSDPRYGQGGYFYFYTKWSRPDQLNFPTVPGFEMVKIWDEKRDVAERMARIYFDKPKICKTFEEVSDDVDLVLIADCSGDGSDHLKLAAPGLKKGIVTFIDKPFAYDVRDARAIVAMAKRHHTSVLSLSLLRVLPQAAEFRARFSEVAPIYLGVIRGYSGTMAAHIHGISLAQHLFGRGVEWVEAMGDLPLEYLHLHYPPKGSLMDGEKGMEVMIIGTGGGPDDAAFASVYQSKVPRGIGAIHSRAFGDWLFPCSLGKIWRMIKRMVQARQPQIPYGEMIEGIAIATAARLSQKEHRKVFLHEV